MKDFFIKTAFIMQTYVHNQMLPNTVLSKQLQYSQTQLSLKI